MKNSNLVAESDRHYYLDIIIAESGRLSRLSDNLLMLASLEAENHPFEAIMYNLDEQIRQTVVTCEPQWSAKGIRIDLEVADAVKIMADRDQLNQVWMNLLGNSIKFTPIGGHIEIRITHSVNEIIFAITDSGIGQQELQDILGYSTLLEQAHAWKERFSQWYDCSPDVQTAEQWLEHWLIQGEQLQHPPLTACLKTIRNWRMEILNYHRCRWTNAAVEGRNNRMKAFQALQMFFYFSSTMFWIEPVFLLYFLVPSS